MLIALSASGLAETAIMDMAVANTAGSIPTVLIIVGAVIVVLLGIAILIPWAVKRGINVSGALTGTTEVLSTAEFVIDGLTGIMPGTKGISIANSIIKYAQEGVAAAEQMYKAHKLVAEERNKKAIVIVYGLLDVAGIEVTEDVKKVVEGCIEAAVRALPKTSEAA